MGMSFKTSKTKIKNKWNENKKVSNGSGWVVQLLKQIVGNLTIINRDHSDHLLFG